MVASAIARDWVADVFRWSSQQCGEVLQIGQWSGLLDRLLFGRRGAPVGQHSSAAIGP